MVCKQEVEVNFSVSDDDKTESFMQILALAIHLDNVLGSNINFA